MQSTKKKSLPGASFSRSSGHTPVFILEDSRTNRQIIGSFGQQELENQTPDVASGTRNKSEDGNQKTIGRLKLLY